MPNPVIAVVPTYNRAKQLNTLLPALTDERQGYSEVIVLDDASTEPVVDVALAHGAYPFRGNENLGAAGNRNRILDDRFNYLGSTTLHFVDSDALPVSTGNAGTITDIFADETVAVAGGLTRKPDGTIEPFNFGPSFTVRAAIGSLFNLREAALAERDPDEARAFRERHKDLLAAWPSIADVALRQPTFWVNEGNMAISHRMLANIGGFPPIRFHEAQGVGIEVARRGFTTLFDPRLEAVHQHGGGSPTNRTMDTLKANAYLIKRYGLGRFLFGGDRATGKVIL